MKYYIGIDLGGTNIAAGIATAVPKPAIPSLQELLIKQEKLLQRIVFLL